MSRFPKDCWGKNCEHFHVMDMSVDDLLCACDVNGMECDACDEDFSFVHCPLAEEGEWIKTVDKYDEDSSVQCSTCLEEFDYIDGVCYLCHGYELPLFCPNCGADMRGEKDE